MKGRSGAISHPTALDTAFNVAYSLTAWLAELSGRDVDFVASLMSETAQREM